MVEHIVLAMAIQAAGLLLLRSWWAGAFAACAWAISREITQAEYRWIEQFGAGLRQNMPWWGGFDLRVWQRPDPWLDWLVPCLTVGTIALIASWKKSPVQK